MALKQEPIQASTLPGGIDVDQANVDKLHKNAIGLPGVLYFCLAGSAPVSAMLFNVPTMASQAGAATPLVFLLSGIALLLLGASIVYFSRRLTSAGGFYTWVRHGLGKGMAFQSGWLMMGGYALFEASMLGGFGSYTNSSLATYLHFQMPGGWVTYALIGAALIFFLSYFDVKWSVYAMAPFMILEMGVLIVLDIAINIHGGASGHDVVHTFTAAGANLKNAAPGGILGIGVAMALGVWSWVGFEAGAVYGEEARNPRKAVPFAVFAVILILTLLYTWTSYSATIGFGWLHSIDQLGNLTATTPAFYQLANTYTGGLLEALMIIAISTSSLACALAFHNGMAHYLYAMGREGILGQVFGKTHPKYHSPNIAIITQTIFTLLVILFSAFILQSTRPNTSGAYSYSFGIGDGKNFTQIDGLAMYGWLAIIGTIAFVVVYITINIAAPTFAIRHDRQNFRVFTHIIAPILSSLVLLIPLVSFIMPAIPGPIGSYFTGLGFASTPFPLNILPIFVVVWLIIGIVYANYVARRAPERYSAIGLMIRTDVHPEALETVVLASETV
ncbi:APC family permease [Dictyobacter arantiisoli]|uniref:Amino acid permease n=1 Tax=Dictyobacter arantiisoli TaxID=2014874 RepID=A0A5A5T742_9CHLR|nr:APC family permease [Dictyobacter arantiisoli]GCF06779.1 amino acid permease [Dictyobacter arantiisoli]